MLQCARQPGSLLSESLSRVLSSRMKLKPNQYVPVLTSPGASAGNMITPDRSFESTYCTHLGARVLYRTLHTHLFVDTLSARN